MIKLNNFLTFVEGGGVISGIWLLHSLEYMNEVTKLFFTVVIGTFTIYRMLRKKTK